jgi:catechol 2,3-dioxygenase-like lactoylglutathione lyase family enzyme
MDSIRIAHVNLSVDDVDAARAFYGELLGLAPLARPADAGRTGCWYAVGDLEIHISLEEGADNRSSKRHVAFEVGDLAALRARFAAARVAIDDGSPMQGIDRFFVRDPAGNRLEFYVRTGSLAVPAVTE